MQLYILRLISAAWGYLFVLILLFRLIQPRYCRAKTAALTVGILCPLFLADLFLMLRLGQPEAVSFFILVDTLPSFLFFYLIAQDRTARLVFTFCAVNTIAYWILSATELLDYYAGGGGLLLFAARLVSFPLFNWWVCKWLRPHYKELQERTPSGWGLFATLSLVYYMLLVAMSGSPSSIGEGNGGLFSYLLLLLLMPCTYCTIFAFLCTQMQLYLSQKNAYLAEEQKKRLESQLENQLRIRKLRHDMKGNVVTLSGLLTSGRTQEALEYLKNMGADIDVAQHHFCGNPYLDSVFSHYSQKFKELGTEVRMDIQIGGESLPNERLLCQILANGMENACDALQKLPQEAREFSAQMRYSRDYLLIRLKNRCQEYLLVERGSIPSSTKDGEEHGLGLLTVQDYVRRMEGEVFCYTENGYFVMDVMVKVRRNQMAGKGAAG